MMFNFQSFGEVFAFDPECSYDEITVSTIEANRKDLEGLFIDRVMKATGIHAVQYLTHPSLIPTFADEILEVLVRKSKDDLTFALAYYHTAQPTLTSRSAIECLFSAIARTSVTEGFYFARGQPQYAQRHMFEMLISVVLNNSPPATIGDRSLELVSLPLSSEEDVWLGEYLLHGDGRNLKKGKDTVMMRKIGMGNFTDSLAMRGINSRPIGQLDWSNLLEGIKHGLGPRLDE
ncbi:hypothetical protein IFR05_007517 [Cadophora sp. M221]|nr:hypothetical protein IFR05_007517 [Cadophora sp. M221]